MLTVENLSKSFTMHIRDGLVINGFSNVSFSVSAGTILAITGASGIGKSSILKCIYRTYKPTSGSIRYTGKDNDEYDFVRENDLTMISLRRSELGYVSQFFHVIPRVSVIDILRHRYMKRGLSEREATDVSSERLEKVGISKGLWDMYPSTFSGGEKQRVNVLLALASEPRLLLLDEPTASLDESSKRIILELLLEAKTGGTTMIGVFHDQEAIVALADSQYKMEGRAT